MLADIILFKKKNPIRLNYILYEYYANDKKKFKHNFVTLFYSIALLTIANSPHVDPPTNDAHVYDHGSIFIFHTIRICLIQQKKKKKTASVDLFIQKGGTIPTRCNDHKRPPFKTETPTSSHDQGQGRCSYLKRGSIGIMNFLGNVCEKNH
jgi:hypothetical protein